MTHLLRLTRIGRIILHSWHGRWQGDNDVGATGGLGTHEQIVIDIAKFSDLLAANFGKNTPR
jgi:hypothetical protein